MSEHEHQIETDYDDEITYCEVHPDRETGLRCNKCDRLMCVECVVQTSVGYRCKECTRQHDDKFFRGSQNEDLLVVGICGGLAFVASAIITWIGGWLLLAIFLGLPVGGGIAQLAIKQIKGNRTRNTVYFATAATVIGGFLGGVAYYVYKYNDVRSNLRELYEQSGFRITDELLTQELGSMSDWVINNVTNNIGLILFVGIVAFAVYSRFRM